MAQVAGTTLLVLQVVIPLLKIFAVSGTSRTTTAKWRGSLIYINILSLVVSLVPFTGKTELVAQVLRLLLNKVSISGPKLFFQLVTQVAQVALNREEFHHTFSASCGNGATNWQNLSQCHKLLCNS